MTNDAEQSVRDVEAAYDAAWGTGDVSAILACLTDDAVLISPRGDEARGHLEIETLLRDFLAREASGTEHVSTVLRVEFATDDVAIVDGEAVIARPSGDEPEVLRHGYTDVLVRRNGRWLIGHIRGYPLG
jgi:uncharacterized protein (TIGR02246 family)